MRARQSNRAVAANPASTLARESWLSIRLTKLSDERHRLSYVRKDGSGETLELETKSILMHDLLHFAVESEAGLTASFYGSLAKSGPKSVKPLAAPASLVGETLATERIIGVLTGSIKADAAAAVAIRGAATLYRAYGEAPPRWFTEEFVGRAQERLRRLLGEWRALPYGATMELRFPPVRAA